MVNIIEMRAKNAEQLFQEKLLEDRDFVYFKEAMYARLFYETGHWLQDTEVERAEEKANNFLNHIAANFFMHIEDAVEEKIISTSSVLEWINIVNKESDGLLGLHLSEKKIVDYRSQSRHGQKAEKIWQIYVYTAKKMMLDSDPSTSFEGIHDEVVVDTMIRYHPKEYWEEISSIYYSELS